MARRLKPCVVTRRADTNRRGCVTAHKGTQESLQQTNQGKKQADAATLLRQRSTTHYQQQPRATTALKDAGRTRKRAETRRWVSWLFGEERATAKVFFTRQRYSAGFGKSAGTTAGCRNDSATTRLPCILFLTAAFRAAEPSRHKKRQDHPDPAFSTAYKPLRASIAPHTPRRKQCLPEWRAG